MTSIVIGTMKRALPNFSLGNEKKVIRGNGSTPSVVNETLEHVANGNNPMTV